MGCRHGGCLGRRIGVGLECGLTPILQENYPTDSPHRENTPHGLTAAAPRAVRTP